MQFMCSNYRAYLRYFETNEVVFGIKKNEIVQVCVVFKYVKTSKN